MNDRKIQPKNRPPIQAQPQRKIYGQRGPKAKPSEASQQKDDEARAEDEGMVKKTSQPPAGEQGTKRAQDAKPIKR